MGLRNSFDFTFDPVVPGRIFASENGPGCDDEMNRIEAGYNYGWRADYPCDDTLRRPRPRLQHHPPAVVHRRSNAAWPPRASPSIRATRYRSGTTSSSWPSTRTAGFTTSPQRRPHRAHMR